MDNIQITLPQWSGGAFKNTLLKIQDEAMHDQKELLDKELADWMGNNPQIDDILIVGVRV